MRTISMGQSGSYSPNPGAGTATQQAFGTLAGAPAGGDSRRVTYGLLSVGSLSLIGLIALYCSLPR
jgi:hypothetical protein